MFSFCYFVDINREYVFFLIQAEEHLLCHSLIHELRGEVILHLFLESHREPAVGFGDRNYLFVTVGALFIDVVVSFEYVVEVWWVKHA